MDIIAQGFRQLHTASFDPNRKSTYKTLLDMVIRLLHGLPCKSLETNPPMLPVQPQTTPCPQQPQHRVRLSNDHALTKAKMFFDKITEMICFRLVRSRCLHSRCLELKVSQFQIETLPSSADEPSSRITFFSSPMGSAQPRSQFKYALRARNGSEMCLTNTYF